MIGFEQNEQHYTKGQLCLLQHWAFILGSREEHSRVSCVGERIPPCGSYLKVFERVFLKKKFLRLTFNTSSLILASNLNAWLGKRPSVCLLINIGDGIESNLVITIAGNLFEMTFSYFTRLFFFVCSDDIRYCLDELYQPLTD